MKQLSFKTTATIFLLSMSIGTIISSCKKTVDEGYGKPQQPSISGISPTSGPFGTVVTISGKWLGDSTTGTTVTLNGKNVPVKSVAMNRVEITIPDSSNPGPIAIKNKYGQAAGPDFNYVYTYTPVTSTLAGSETAGNADGQGTVAQFDEPSGIVIDAQGNLYVADSYNDRIRKITPSGLVSTLAGGSTFGFADGQGSAAKFNLPFAIAIDAQGNNLYVADTYNSRIRKVTLSGLVSTVAGSGAFGFLDGLGTAAQFDEPYGVTVDGQGNLYVGDFNNDRIRKITSGGLVSTLAGSTTGYMDATGNAAKFNGPSGISIDAQSNLYVTDTYNNRIRKITSGGLVSTLAGSGIIGNTDGQGTTAQFNRSFGVTGDASGNFYIADSYNHRIRKISSDGMVSTIAGSGEGYQEGAGTTAKYRFPTSIAIDATGNLYVTDWGNNCIRKITMVRH